jgi:hypothetical protein
MHELSPDLIGDDDKRADWVRKRGAKIAFARFKLTADFNTKALPLR